jgi:hypothetical protein
MAGPAGSQHRRALPVATVPTPRTNATVYGMATLDCHGRIADHAIQRALGWTPGARLAIREADGLLIIHGDPHGVFRVTGQGHLRLPAQVRHCCGLITGDRVLLAADPTHGRLVIYPPTVLDTMTARHASSLGGDAA